MNVNFPLDISALSAIRHLLVTCMVMTMTSQARLSTDPTGVSNSIGDGGNDIINVIQGEVLNFRFSASTPSGSPAEISNFKLLVDDAPCEAASFVKLAEGGFRVQWTASVPLDYPNTKFLQSIAVRDTTSQETIILGWVDVAEWEGMVAGVSGNGLNSGNFPSVYVVSHHRGIKHLSDRITYGSSTWYRGPKAIPLLDESGSNTGATAQIGAGRYPLFIISKSGSAYTVEQTLDISDPVAYPHHGYFYVNRTSAAITMQPSTVGNLSIPAGGVGFQPFPPAPETGNTNIGVLGTSFINGGQSTIYSGVWELLKPRGTAREFRSLKFTGITHENGTSTVSNDGTGGVRAVIGATITPHSVGTLEYPGMPIGSTNFPPAPYNHHSSTTPLLPIQSEQWHKLVLKVGPDAGAVSNGITLKLGTGDEGENDPQTGFTLQTPDTGSFATLTIPADGKIEMLPSSELYQKLTSLEGLTLFLKQDSTVSEFHRLGLDLIPKKSSYTICRIAALDLLPVDFVDSKDATLDNGNDVSITPKKDAADTNLKSIAWIEPHGAPNEKDPEMPQLALRIGGTEQMGLKIKWKLEVKYKRPSGRSLAEDTVTIQSGGETWTPETFNGVLKIFDNADWKTAVGNQSDALQAGRGFFGGDATLTWQLIKTDGSQLNDEQKILVRIAGKNPDDTLCRQYLDKVSTDITSQANGLMWYAYAIAKSETKDEGGDQYYNQFLKRGAKYKDKKGSEGVPNWNDDGGGKPGGYGVKQVTGYKGNEDANVPRSVIWNWEHNVDEGLRELAKINKEAQSWMQNQRSQATKSLPAHQVLKVVFSDASNHKMEDAVAIKRYNGASRRNAPDSYTDLVGGFTYANETPSRGHYCYWDRPRNKWSLSRYNAYKKPFVYINRVCLEIEP